MNHPGRTTVAGVVNLYKPTGTSSAQYVYRLRKHFGIHKVGHAGTLDPFADGVLLACVGRATKLVERLMALSKHYRTTLRLGVTNQTFDPELPFEPVRPTARPSREAIENALKDFVGDIQQVPPAFSAVKIGGVASHRLARRGRPVARKPKRVQIHRLSITEFDWPRLGLDIHCGRGTYIRAIARDLGRELGCGACCESLTRRAIGPFRIEDAVNLDKASPDAVQAALLSVDDVLRRLARVAGAGRDPDCGGVFKKRT